MSKTLDCGCVIFSAGSFKFCPTHAAASTLLEALEAAGDLWGYLPFDSGADIQEVAQRVAKLQRAAILAAKGEQEVTSDAN